VTNTGVDLRGVQAGGNINIQGVTVGVSEEELVTALERRGLLAGAETAGLQRRTIVALASAGPVPVSCHSEVNAMPLTRAPR